MAANGSLIFGVYLGIKAADKIMWNQRKYEQMQEQIDLDYWKKYGKPEVIQPELYKSSIKEGEFYPTYLRARGRVEYMDEKVYKLHWADEVRTERQDSFVCSNNGVAYHLELFYVHQLKNLS